MTYGCIARRLGHSFSKSIHEKIRDYDYVLREIPETELDAFLTARDFRGINVTIPYKQAVIPWLDGIDDTARAIGAVNTVVNREGKLYGYNTDFGGMTAQLRKMGLPIRGKKVAILGTGGTSRTARAVVQALGAGEIVTVSRSGREGALTYSDLCALHADTEILLNTTPCGMFPDTDEMPVDPARFPQLLGVFDAVFNPLAPKLVTAARELGIPAAGGLYMLVAQAVLAAEHFTGKTYPDGLIDSIYREVRREKENIVLIGMPGSGKTTVGNVLAEKLGREIVDLDAWIVEQTGREITDIFAREGEGEFRRLEREAVRTFADRTGLVLTPGGGCILDKDNVRALRRNGRLFWLDRAPERLIPTDDRPLADSVEKMRRLYETRLPLYEAAADVRVPGDGTVDETARLITEILEGEVQL